MKKVVGIIQARIGSSRLPFKMMLSLHGKPIIEWVVRRVQKASKLDAVVVAIPVTEENDILEAYLQTLNVTVFRGSEGDVLNRFYEAAKNSSATHIVRVCADNPLIDPVEIDRVVEFYEQNRCDYAYNHVPKNNLYPDGLGAEIVSFEILKQMEFDAKNQHYREHCFSYVAENSQLFDIRTFNPDSKLLEHPELRFDIDTFDDYYKLSMQQFDINIDAFELVKLFSGEANEVK